MLLLLLRQWRNSISEASCSIGTVLAPYLLVHSSHDLRRQPKSVDYFVLPLVDEDAILSTDDKK